jgi:hypothetical protein
MKTPGVLQTNGAITGPQAGIASFWQHCFGVGVTVAVLVTVTVLVIVGVLVVVPVRLAVAVAVGVLIGVPVWVRVVLGVAVGRSPATSHPPVQLSVLSNTISGQPEAPQSVAQAVVPAMLSRQKPALQLPPRQTQHMASARGAQRHHREDRRDDAKNHPCPCALHVAPPLMSRSPAPCLRHPRRARYYATIFTDSHGCRFYRCLKSNRYRAVCGAA